MTGFMCFQSFCYVLCRSTEVGAEVLGLTEHAPRKITQDSQSKLLTFKFLIIISYHNISTKKPVKSQFFMIKPYLPTVLIFDLHQVLVQYTRESLE